MPTTYSFRLWTTADQVCLATFGNPRPIGSLVPSWCQSHMQNTIMSLIRTLNGRSKNAHFAGSLASQCFLLWSAGLFVISRSVESDRLVETLGTATDLQSAVHPSRIAPTAMDSVRIREPEMRLYLSDTARGPV